MASPNILEFINSISNDGISKTDKFFCKVNFPNSISLTPFRDTGKIINNLFAGSSSLIYRCEVAEMPSRLIETSNYRTYGPDRKMAHNTAYEEFGITLISDQFFSEKALFDQWQELIQPSIDNWDLNYKDVYKGSIVVQQIDLVTNIIYEVTLVNAFPVMVDKLPLNWNDESVHRLSVRFAYDYWIPSNKFSFIYNDVLGVV